MQYVKIPKERVAVLIGEKGNVKRDIEKRTNTKIKIEDASVSIDSTGEDSMREWVAKDIVLAIGRGFSPEIARRLLNDEFTLAIIQLRDFAGTPKAMERMKGRVIGEGGRSRRVIEDLTDTYLSVYGKTIAIIGSHDDVHLAKDATVRLIEGARHASVWRFLEKAKRQSRFSPPETLGVDVQV